MFLIIHLVPINIYGGTNACKQLNTGIWGMIAADGNADGQVDNTDKDDIWQTEQEYFWI